MQVIIGTKNKAKIKAVTNVCEHYLENVHIASIACPSGVSEQPIGNEETRQGAINRALKTLSCKVGDIGVGLEGGVMYVGKDMYLCNWGAIVIKGGPTLTAAGAQIPLSENIRKEIESGQELGPVIDRVFKQQGIRHSEGAMGIFTNGTISRVKLFEHIMALLIGQYLYLEKSE